MLVHGCEEGNIYTPAAISEDQSYGMVYIPENQPVYINMSIFHAETVSAMWFNPRNGTYSPCGSYKNSETFVGFRPPQEDTDPDYVLVLVSQA